MPTNVTLVYLRLVVAAIACTGLLSTAQADTKPSASLCRQVQPAAAKANCVLVVDFYDGAFNGRDIGAAEKAIGPTYKQHNPAVPDGREALFSYLSSYVKEDSESRLRIVRVSASGDLVWLHVHATRNPSDRGTAIVDIFRVTKGRIVEHWDVMQPVPEKSANSNTMF